MKLLHILLTILMVMCAAFRPEPCAQDSSCYDDVICSHGFVYYVFMTKTVSKIRYVSLNVILTKTVSAKKVFV
eukprot:UN19356